MALAAEFAALREALAGLDQAVDGLLWAVVQGQPGDGPGHALVDRYEAAASEAQGSIREGRSAAERGLQASVERIDLLAARRALITCQECVNRVTERYCGDLASSEWVRALDGLARRRPAEWGPWVGGVHDALGQCPLPLRGVSEAVFRCWRELTEDAVLLSVAPPRRGAGHVAQARGGGHRRRAETE